LAAAVVLVIYGTIACTAGSELGSRTPAEDFYNRLADGFAKGQLSLDLTPPPGLALLADPYDPRANAPFQGQAYEPGRYHDLSYFHGKFYLYFSAVPAVLLFLPFHLLTGAYVSHQQACFLFCSIGFLAAAALVESIRRHSFPSAGPAAAALATLCAGLASLIPIVLQRPDVWEVPITCAYACWMCALLLLWSYLNGPARAWPKMLGASIAVGLAIGCRPNSILGGALLLWPLIRLLREHPPAKGLAVSFLLLPPAVIGTALLAYNLARFGSIFNFGQNYQIAGDVERIRHFRVSFIWYNLRLYFLEYPGWQSAFPFVRDLRPPPYPAGYVVVETPVAVLTELPFILCAAAIPFWLCQAGEGQRQPLAGVLGAMLILIAAGAGSLSLYFAAAVRYQMEFVPLLALMAAVGFLALASGFRQKRRLLVGAAVVAATLSIAFNLLMAVNQRALTDTRRGLTEMRAGRQERAAELYRRALRLRPANDVALVDLANILVHQENYAEAGVTLARALALLPNSAALHLNYAYCLFRTGRLHEALAECETALKLQPDFPDARKIEQAIRLSPGAGNLGY
jgi:hypothetical protein